MGLRGVRVKVDMKTPAGYPCPSLSLGEAVEDAGHTQHRGVDDPRLLNFEDKQQPTEIGQKQFKAMW